MLLLLDVSAPLTFTTSAAVCLSAAIISPCRLLFPEPHQQQPAQLMQTATKPESYAISCVYCSPYVLPEHYIIPVIPGDFNQVERPRGMLFVTIVSAKNVPKMDWFNGSDPYVRYTSNMMVCCTDVPATCTTQCINIYKCHCHAVPYVACNHPA